MYAQLNYNIQVRFLFCMCIYMFPYELALEVYYFRPHLHDKEY